jgi:Sulfotransferase domain
VTLKVVGAGLARTGTASLKLALEQLLGGPCYHMLEVFAHPAHIPVWHRAAHGQLPSWDSFLDGYRAAVDLPASAFWQELAAASPGALILLSVRDTAEQWWDSASHTVFDPSRTSPPAGTPLASLMAMVNDIWRQRVADCDLTDKTAMISGYQRHNDMVRAQAPPQRLLEWRPGDGWAPIAAALRLPVPDSPFPKVNTRAQFRIPDFGESADVAATS